MTYEQAVNYIHSSPKFPKKPGNAPLLKILNEFGNPQDKLKYVHVAGTNGKGSVCAMTESVLRRCGYKTGLFTSPYIEEFGERIRVCGEMISGDELAEITSEVKGCMEKTGVYLPEFSLIFAIAAIYFERCSCEVVILETGLGGRLDATNAIKTPLVCAITSIGYDHMQYLGNTIEEICSEKCGIIKENSSVVLYPVQKDAVFRVVSEFCKRENAELIVPQLPEINTDNTFSYDGRKYKLSLEGDFQAYNAVVAIEVLRTLSQVGYTISFRDVYDGLADTFWPARLEWVSDNIIIDGCHNEDGAAAFARELKKEKRSTTIVFCAMKDKDVDSIIKILCTLGCKIIITELDMARSFDSFELAEKFSGYGITADIVRNPSEAVMRALSQSDVCAVCGSLYLAGEVRKKYAKKHLH